MLGTLFLGEILACILVSTQVNGQISWDKPSAPLRRLQVLKRCTDNVQRRFTIPESLRYPYNSMEKMEHLKKVLQIELFDFSLRTNPPNCISGTFNVQVPIDNEAVIDGSDKPESLFFAPDGALTYLVIIVQGDGNKTETEITYHRENYCIAGIDENSISLNLCKSKCYLKDEQKGENPCLPRCCALGAISSGYGQNSSDICEPTYGADWTPRIFGDTKLLPAPQIVVNDRTLEWKCPDDLIVGPIRNESRIRILPDGKILTMVSFNGVERWEEASSGNMPYQTCIDGYWDKEKYDIYHPSNSLVIIRRCMTPIEERLAAVTRMTKVQIFGIHIPCALMYFLILGIYLSIWDKHRAHGWTVVGFAASQFSISVLLTSINSAFVFGDNAASFITSLHGVCVLFGILHHFFSLSTYTWTLVLTFDVWTTLRSITPESSRSKGVRIMLYTAFAVGVPTLIVLVATVIEFQPKLDSVITPGYRGSCITRGGMPFFLYIGLEQIALYLMNLSLALATLKLLWIANTNSQKLTKSQSKSTMGSKAVLLSKLVFVMGFALVFEFILNFGELTKRSEYLGLLNFYRLLQALGLFWTFVFGAKTKQNIQEKYPVFYRKVFDWRKGTEESSGMTMESKIN